MPRSKKTENLRCTHRILWGNHYTGQILVNELPKCSSEDIRNHMLVAARRIACEKLRNVVIPKSAYEETVDKESGWACLYCGTLALPTNFGGQVFKAKLGKWVYPSPMVPVRKELTSPDPNWPEKRFEFRVAENWNHKLLAEYFANGYDVPPPFDALAIRALVVLGEKVR